MGLIVNLLLRASDLVEAEGRAAHRAICDLARSIVLHALAAGVALLALSVLSAALLGALAEVMSTPAALACVGAALAAIAALLAWAGGCASPRRPRGSGPRR